MTAPRPLRVVIAGATGLLGSALARDLARDGHRAIALTRRPAGPDDAGWDPAAGRLDPAALAGADAVVQLTGVPPDRRWTAAARRAIRDSRVAPTALLARTIARLERRPRVLVTASGTAFYGDRGEEWLDESSPAGEGFLARLVAEWEAAATPAREAGVRVVHLRTGPVIASRGRFLGRMVPLFRLGLGGPIGSGRQWLSWIEIEDLVAAMRLAIGDDALSGPVNAVTPEPVRNADFARALGAALGRPALIPVPAFALRLVFGRAMADATVLASARVRPARLEALGYRFRHPRIGGALEAALGRRPETGR